MKRKEKKLNKENTNTWSTEHTAQAQAQKLHKIESQIEGPTTIGY